MIGLFLSLFSLGLAAIDPLGIAAMPILLAQKRPYIRSAIFLSGSLVSLVLMGLLFSMGLGASILRVAATYLWIVPLLELLAGIVLFISGVYILKKIRRGENINEQPSVIGRRLHLGDWTIFFAGALLVAVQSLVDVVFAIAMIKLETLKLSFEQLLLGIGSYAFGALLLQIVIIAIYRITPFDLRKNVIEQVNRLTQKHTYYILVVVSFALGGLLIINIILRAMGCALF